MDEEGNGKVGKLQRTKERKVARRDCHPRDMLELKAEKGMFHLLMTALVSYLMTS
jgi:hypothetical protein